MALQQNPDRAGNPGADLPATASAAPHPRPSGRGAFRERNPQRKPITHNGVTYKTQAALARALDLSEQRVSQAIKRGRLDTLGAGSLNLKPEDIARAREARRQPCAAHGWHWPSQKDAAKALGVDGSVVTRFLERGTFEKQVLKRLGINSAAAAPPPAVEN